MTVEFITSGTSWTAPTGVTSVTAEAIGGGGHGGATSLGSFGGGGGAYAKTTGITVTPGNSYGLSIGAGGTSTNNGGDTWFCNSTSNCASISGTAVQVGAKGGGDGVWIGCGCANDGVHGKGGSSSSSIGSTKYSGGDGDPTATNLETGGGGSAGPVGAGLS